VLCQLSDELREHLDKNSSVVEHLANAKREVLEAVREFIDVQLDTVEKGIQRRKRKRAGRKLTRIEVE
jgi:hypothetical protein